MKIMNIQSNASFGRALSSQEKKEYSKTISEARKNLGIDKTTATIFDFSVPSAKNDTGIGTSFSKDAQELAAFLNNLCGVNSIQLQPQGEISNYIHSPYSGTSFALGMHTIDLTKLAEPEYGSLLTCEDLESPYMNRIKDHNNVDYNNVFSEDGQKTMLKKAFTEFEQLDKSDPLKKEFNSFKKSNGYWLESFALFEACAEDNNSDDMTTWPLEDQNIYSSKNGNKNRIKELKKVTDEDGNNVVEFEEFVQFIADKQQKESKADFNAQGIDVYGDGQIGFSQKDYWAHKYAFYPDYEFGCDIGEGNYACWSPAVDFSKIDKEAGELLYNKFDTMFKRYDGVRIDAAWQLINPTICKPLQHNGNSVFDDKGNKLGRKIDNQPKVDKKGQKIIEDIILKTADKNNVSHDKIFLELLGGNSYDSLDAVKGTGSSLIHITRYGDKNWGRVKYYESKGDNKYQNMKPGDYIIGPGTHDDFSLIEQVKNGKNRAGYLAEDLNLNQKELEKSPEKLADAVFAELFTTKNQFATLPDILGSERRINTPNTTAGNWTYRAPQNYEQEYYQNLSQGKGLNTPDALSKAIKAKQNGNSNELTKKLDYFANILRQKGPMTTQEADSINLNA